MWLTISLYCYPIEFKVIQKKRTGG
jgi:hypothetical protein